MERDWPFNPAASGSKPPGSSISLGPLASTAERGDSYFLRSGFKSSVVLQIARVAQPAEAPARDAVQWAFESPRALHGLIVQRQDTGLSIRESGFDPP